MKGEQSWNIVGSWKQLSKLAFSNLQEVADTGAAPDQILVVGTGQELPVTVDLFKDIRARKNKVNKLASLKATLV